MKKLKYLVVLLAILLIIPFGVYADDESSTESTESAETEETTEESTDSKEVNVYFFRGEGCSHCAEAEEWFESIEEEYGDYFNIVDYEVWYDEDNSNLMQQVADLRGEDVEGVPYIIIGDMSWNGFDESYEDDMIDKIKEVYAEDVDDRYDIMNYLDSSSSAEEEESYGSDIAVLIVIILVAGGIGAGIYFARKSN